MIYLVNFLIHKENWKHNVQWLSIITVHFYVRISYGDWIESHYFSPDKVTGYLWELTLSLRNNDKLQVTSESQENILTVYHFSKYSTTTYSLSVSLHKFTSWIFLQILYIKGYMKHGEPMVIVTIMPC